MALLAMPLVVLNMGCEMLYILDQRLHAQEVAADKGVRVLLDVFRTMFDKTFVRDRLCAPQEVATVAETRKVFDRLAHSSIMRLSEARRVSLPPLPSLPPLAFLRRFACAPPPHTQASTPPSSPH